MKLVLVGGAGAVVLVAALLAAGALRPSGGVTHPPCDQLPSRAAVADALAKHAEMVERMRKVSPAVRVEVDTPCEGQPDRALVAVRYNTDAERDGIEVVFREGFGFGAPAWPVKN